MIHTMIIKLLIVILVFYNQCTNNVYDNSLNSIFWAAIRNCLIILKK
jgi:hypothetical protein